MEPPNAVWDADPPQGTPYYTHLCSLVAMFAVQSNLIYQESEFTSSADTLTCGIRALSAVECLPHFSIAGSLPSTRHKGQLGRWKVFLDPELGEWEMKLSLLGSGLFRTLLITHGDYNF